MKKYNLSKIMKNAWAMFRKGGKLFSECLRKAWAIAKGLAKKQFTGFANLDGFEVSLSTLREQYTIFSGKSQLILIYF